MWPICGNVDILKQAASVSAFQTMILCVPVVHVFTVQFVIGFYFTLPETLSAL